MKNIRFDMMLNLSHSRSNAYTYLRERMSGVFCASSRKRNGTRMAANREKKQDRAYYIQWKEEKERETITNCFMSERKRERNIQTEEKISKKEVKCRVNLES
jgi:hypothetical protein